MYVRKWKCFHYLGNIFLIKTMISVFQCAKTIALKYLKFSVTAISYVLMSLPCMISSSFTQRFFMGWCRHKYQKFSPKTVWIWLFCFKYLLSFILLVFWYRRSDSNSEIWYILQIHFTKKKLLCTDFQLLRQCKFCNCHHSRQLTETHFIVCY